MKKIIGIDMGKDNLKAYDGDKTFICSSTFGVNVDRLEAGYQVLLDGKKYLIGDDTLDYDYDVTKEKERHRIMMYLAIAQLTNDGDCVSVVTSCPVDIFLNKNLKNSYKNFLSERKEVIITVGIQTKKIFIDKVFVVCEGVGIAYRHPNRFLNQVVGVIDIGGVTKNYLFFNDMNLVRDQSFSEADGMHFLRAKVTDALKKEGHYLTSHEIKPLIRNPKDYKYIVNKEIDKFINGIHKTITRRNWSSVMELIFVGGGSDDLKRQISERFPTSTVSAESLFDNCIGNYQIGVLKWQKSEKSVK